MQLAWKYVVRLLNCSVYLGPYRPCCCLTGWQLNSCLAKALAPGPAPKVAPSLQPSGILFRHVPWYHVDKHATRRLYHASVVRTRKVA